MSYQIRQITGVALVALLAAGCMGDPEPDPSLAPLEVVVDTCTLNRTSVAPGTHEVALVGSGTVVVTDAAGAQVASLTGPGSIVTTSQVFTFTCTGTGGRTTATLTSQT